MVKAETPAPGECFTADPGREPGPRAVERRAGTAVRRPAGAVGDGTIRTMIRTGERGVQ
jgi:hypothetical protein